MKLNSANLVVISVLINHIYIALLNTSSLHGMPIPDRRILTALLLFPLLYLGYIQMKSPSVSINETLLYLAIALSIGGSILRIMGISASNLPYLLMMVFIAIFTWIALMSEKKPIVILYLIIFFLEIILLVASQYFVELVFEISLVVEALILLTILFINYRIGLRTDELFVVIIMTLVGFELGRFLGRGDLTTLITGTMFEQTLNLGGYTVTKTITKELFLAIHLAEVFNLLTIHFILPRSKATIAIALTGFELSYPPLAGFRAIAILIWLRQNSTNKATVDDNRDQSKNSISGNKDQTG